MSVLEPAATRLMTAEEFLARYNGNPEAELVNGEVGEGMAAGANHSHLGAKLIVLVGTAVYRDRLGLVTSSDGGYVLSRDPDTVRVPDLAFVRAERVPQPRPRGLLELAPDLAVEVVSPHDRAGQVISKAWEWVDAGVPVVWLVWPDDQSVWVCRPDHQLTQLHGDAILTCPDLLPGFELALPELFA